jgi:DNA-binding CsgD family transcriptional regulator
MKVDYKTSQLAAYQNMGRLFLITDRIDSSKYYLNKAVDLAEEINSPLVRADAMGNLAELNYSENKVDEAIEKWSASIETYLDAGEVSRSFHSFRNIIEAYEKVGNYKFANEYLKKYHALADSLYTVEKEKAIASLENEIEVTEKENEIELLQAQKKSEQRKTYFFISLFVLAATGGAAITIKLRSDRKLKAKKNEVLQKELEVKTTQEERLRSELQLKSRALTKEGLRIIQKNKQLEDFKDRINELSKKVPGEARSDLNGIKSALKYAFSVDKDWKEFSVYFEDVHPQFLKKLDDLNPKLTPKEKRLCALMKVEMSTKEIASVLNISPDSVKKAKTRLRRKLNVEPREDLIEKIDV